MKFLLPPYSPGTNLVYIKLPTQHYSAINRVTLLLKMRKTKLKKSARKTKFLPSFDSTLFFADHDSSIPETMENSREGIGSFVDKTSDRVSEFGEFRSEPELKTELEEGTSPQMSLFRWWCQNVSAEGVVDVVCGAEWVLCAPWRTLNLLRVPGVFIRYEWHRIKLN
ncbi:hypothetical protein CDAR_452881 [Caerostris darwini]|uniref:Uncharacterized protein n=1 Tax=Caerostris darwini TaxID=1538125 RepID=A0AAV4SLL9_9ARAC|nr:hypothetical protein CDAR_452881 [Caerostris darwini]